MTPQGEIEVERLAIGEPVLTAEGAPVPVKWIGCQTVSTFFGPAERLMPVRISAGALGNDLPHSDLTVTADHGMLVEGVICHAGALVNGETITRVPLSEMAKASRLPYRDRGSRNHPRKWRPGRDLIDMSAAGSSTTTRSSKRSTAMCRDGRTALPPRHVRPTGAGVDRSQSRHSQDGLTQDSPQPGRQGRGPGRCNLFPLHPCSQLPPKTARSTHIRVTTLDAAVKPVSVDGMCFDSRGS